MNAPLCKNCYWAGGRYQHKRALCFNAKANFLFTNQERLDPRGECGIGGKLFQPRLRWWERMLGRKVVEVE